MRRVGGEFFGIVTEEERRGHTVGRRVRGVVRVCRKRMDHTKRIDGKQDVLETARLSRTDSEPLEIANHDRAVGRVVVLGHRDMERIGVVSIEWVGLSSRIHSLEYAVVFVVLGDRQNIRPHIENERHVGTAGSVGIHTEHRVEAAGTARSAGERGEVIAHFARVQEHDGIDTRVGVIDVDPHLGPVLVHRELVVVIG